MNKNYPAGVSDKDFNDPKMTKFKPKLFGECQYCCKHDELNDEWTCEDCFEPKETKE